MKKVLFIAALFASMAVASAQQFGVIGGMTLSSMDGAAKPDENKAMFLYQAGVVYKMDLGAGFAVQPSLTYQVKGATLKQNNDVTTKTGFAELGIGAQWGPDLLAFRPFVFVEPFVGYGVTGKEDLSISGLNISASKEQKEALVAAKNKLEYGLGAGLGLEFGGHVQLTCQLFRNMGLLYKEGEFDTGKLVDIKSSYKDLKNYQGVKVSLAILF